LAGNFGNSQSFSAKGIRNQQLTEANLMFYEFGPIFTAKYDGICANCRGYWSPGDEVGFCNGEIVCAHCHDALKSDQWYQDYMDDLNT